MFVRCVALCLFSFIVSLCLCVTARWSGWMVVCGAIAFVLNGVCLFVFVFCLFDSLIVCYLVFLFVFC